MEKKSLSRETIREGFKKPSIKNENLTQAVGIILSAVSEHLEKSEAVNSFKSKVNQSDSSANLKFMEDFMFPVFSFERNCFQETIFENQDLRKKEAELLNSFFVLSGLFDNLYLHWFNKMIITYHSLNDQEKVSYEKAIKKAMEEKQISFKHLVFDYSSRTGITNCQTLAEAFPGEINSIVSILQSSSVLSNEDYAPYFWAIKNAYACRNLSEVEDLWKKVDEKWLAIPDTCRILPIHGTERCEHGFCVAPEFRLLIKTASEKQELLNQIKNSTSNLVEQIGVREDLAREARRIISNLNLDFFITFLRAGAAVANQQEIFAKGENILIDCKAIEHELDNYKKLLNKCCESDKKDLFAEMITAEGLIAQKISHQYAHKVGCTPEINLQLGEKKFILEEAKATCGGIASILENLPLNKQLELLMLSVARVCGFFASKKHKCSTNQPHFNENLAMANLMIKAGLIEVGNKNLKIKLSKEGLEKWQISLKEFYYEIIKSYHSTNPDKINRKKIFYCQITPEIRKWISLAQN